jgi:hypothetical protein
LAAQRDRENLGEVFDADGGSGHGTMENPRSVAGREMGCGDSRVMWPAR